MLSASFRHNSAHNPQSAQIFFSPHLLLCGLSHYSVKTPFFYDKMQFLCRLFVYYLLLMTPQDRPPKICFRKQRTMLGKQGKNWRFPKRALLSPSLAPFKFLFDLGCNKSLITLICHHHKAFGYLLDVFALLYCSFTPTRRVVSLNYFLSEKSNMVDYAV